MVKYGTFVGGLCSGRAGARQGTKARLSSAGVVG